MLPSLSARPSTANSMDPILSIFIAPATNDLWVGVIVEGLAVLPSGTFRFGIAILLDRVSFSESASGKKIGGKNGLFGWEEQFARRLRVSSKRATGHDRTGQKLSKTVLAERRVTASQNKWSG